MNKPYVVHLSFSADVNRHADITRYNVIEGMGTRELINVRDTPVPDADAYVVEHFLSTDPYVNALPDSIKRRSVLIVHTDGCVPTGPWKRVIALTHSWKRILTGLGVPVSRVIYPGIDLAAYDNMSVNYDRPVFGRMTRWNAQKIPPNWNTILREVLDAVPKAMALFYISYVDTSVRPFSDHPRVGYRGTCQIHMFKGRFLKELSVYVHANHIFRETFSFATVEAMATGLPILYLDEGTGVQAEVTAGGIGCDNLTSFQQALVYLLKDASYRREYGEFARDAARRFDKNRMIAEFDEEVEACLR